MSAILLTADLACSSKAAGAAARAGAELVTAMSTSALLDKLSSRGAELVLLDLTAPGLNPAELVGQIKSSALPPRAIIAFGPHVHEAKLAAAAEAGCDQVLARGAFYAQLEQLLAESRP